MSDGEIVFLIIVYLVLGEPIGALAFSNFQNEQKTEAYDFYWTHLFVAISIMVLWVVMLPVIIAIYNKKLILKFRWHGRKQAKTIQDLHQSQSN